MGAAGAPGLTAVSALVERKQGCCCCWSGQRGDSGLKHVCVWQARMLTTTSSPAHPDGSKTVSSGPSWTASQAELVGHREKSGSPLGKDNCKDDEQCLISTGLIFTAGPHSCRCPGQEQHLAHHQRDSSGPASTSGRSERKAPLAISAHEAAGEKMSDWEIISYLSGYLFPKDNPEYRWRVVSAMGLLVASKGLSVGVRTLVIEMRLGFWIGLGDALQVYSPFVTVRVPLSSCCHDQSMCCPSIHYAAACTPLIRLAAI